MVRRPRSRRSSRSVRNARLQSKEIIVVNDCSQDGTQAVLQKRVSQMGDRIISSAVRLTNSWL
ncbi:MAG: hypothetical protein DME99_01680 [Verrucomicrobia bacterium]|nr:MAG: hypothetical protein DME99_01680 [Verrucomicrobiota bacterium]